MSESIYYREAVRADGPSLCKCLDHLAKTHLSFSEAANRTAELVRVPDTYLLVAVEASGSTDKRVVGTATLVIMEKMIHRGGRLGQIEDVVVVPEYQHQGIGCNLVGWCIDKARERGCYKVVLNCTDKLQGFYEHLGFKPHCLQMRYDI